MIIMHTPEIQCQRTRYPFASPFSHSLPPRYCFQYSTLLPFYLTRTSSIAYLHVLPTLISKWSPLLEYGCLSFGWLCYWHLCRHQEPDRHLLASTGSRGIWLFAGPTCPVMSELTTSSAGSPSPRRSGCLSTTPPPSPVLEYRVTSGGRRLSMAFPTWVREPSLEGSSPAPPVSLRSSSPPLPSMVPSGKPLDRYKSYLNHSLFRLASTLFVASFTRFFNLKRGS